MATVYLADDLRHDRQVAIKVLRPELAAVIGAERFLAEIRTTANLQHPHILPLHDSGAADSFLFYVMPYVEGESLRDRLSREKQLPIADAIAITTEVASALDYAHRHSVIHRDIKPENILLHDGRALVADFGIALAASRAGSGSRMTETGMSLGTPHYMSPEQAMGERDLTARSDVYALGAVTYEMLTGEPPFTGPTAQAIVARVMTEAPRNPRLQRQTIPPHVETAVLTALEKLPADRFATAAAYADSLARPGATVPSHWADAAAPARRRWLMPAVVAGAVLTGAAAGWLLRQPDEPARLPQRFRIMHAQPAEGGVAISPDGRTVVAAVTGGDGELGIFVQQLDQLDPRPLAGSSGGQVPRFSPDGASLVYSVPGRIMRQGLDGSAAVTLVPRGSGGLVVDWGEDGYFYLTNLNGAIARVRETGGEIEDLVVPDSIASGFYAWVDRLPAGKGVLATLVTASYAENRIVVLDLETRELRELVRGSMPRYADGHLLYTEQDGTLFAAPFDAGRLELTGPAIPIARGVWQPGLGRASYDVVGGTLAYQTAPGLVEGRALVLVNRAGERRELPFPRATYNALAISPDGRRVAIETLDGVADGGTISTFTLGDSVLTQLTFEGLNSYPAWSADGSRIAFAREVDGERDFWWQPADGTGRAEPMFRRPRAQYEIDFSRDGQWIAFRDGNASTTDSLALWSVPADGSAEPTQFDAADVGARSPAISPDGRWLAYAARDAVFVRPFPDPGSGAVWQVSTDGGQEPVWARSGRELFYKSGTHLMVAQVETGTAFAIRGRRQLFPIADYHNNTYHQRYAVLPGDSAFVMIQARFGASDLETIVVTDWRAALSAGGR